MKRRRIAVLLSSAAALFLLAALFPYFVNAERFRPTIETRLTTALGRPVQIAKLDFSWLAGGISAKDISIGEDPAFGTKPFLSARALDVSVELRPLLFRRELRIRSLTVREPEIRLAELNGRWNIASLGREEKPSGASAAQSTALWLNKLSITGGRIVVQRTGEMQTYSDLKLSATNVNPNAAFPFTLDVVTPGNGNLKLAGTVGPLRGEFKDLPFDAKVEWKHLDLKSSGYPGAHSAIDGTTSLTATLRSDARTAHIEGTATAERLVLANGGTPSARPVAVNFLADYDFRSESGQITRGDISIGSSILHATGAFDLSSSPAALQMTASAPSLRMTDVQQFLPAVGLSLPGGASLQGGTASMTMAIAGPVNRLVITGPLRLADVTVSGFDLGANLRTVAALAGINTGANTHIQSLSSTVRSAPEGMSLSDLKAAVTGLGSLTGTGTISSSNTLDFRMVAQLTRQGGLIGGLLQRTGIGQLSTVPFRVQGTSSSPKFIPDVNAIMTTKQPANAAQQPKQNSLGGLLNQLLNKRKQ